ncbi:hypothetical protein CK203_042755 [Vitis vinifera]|uniref:Uncharacterized protein n=1 Tax=Vitis vinifera TaxID=29760 RepID=A0A438HQP9_VITVI|nr:hypothetical protein CK203_042755 [Vitis vinifera]
MKGEESSSKAEQGKNQGSRAPISSPEAQRTPRAPAEEPLESRTPTSLHFGHGKTRGGLSASPSSPTPRPQRAAMGAAASPPVQAPAIPPSEGEVLLSADTHQEATHGPCATSDRPRACFSAPCEETRFSGPGEPSHAPQPEPATEEPRIPVTCLPRPLSGVP